MINDEERREVAARLRACAQDVNGMRDFAMYLSNWVGVEGVADDEGNQFSVAADRRIAERTLEKLADLIDRPTYKMVREDEGFRCSACGTFHDMSGFEEFPWSYCPRCGAEVVS